MVCSLKTSQKKVEQITINVVPGSAHASLDGTKRLTPIHLLAFAHMHWVRCLKSSPRPISTSQLKRLLALHTWPINLVVYKGPY